MLQYLFQVTIKRYQKYKCVEYLFISKLSREISNSQWIINGKALANTSVEQILASVITPSYIPEGNF